VAGWNGALSPLTPEEEDALAKEIWESAFSDGEPHCEFEHASSIARAMCHNAAKKVFAIAARLRGIKG
jgi:hypothetical protein